MCNRETTQKLAKQALASHMRDFCLATTSRSRVRKTGHWRLVARVGAPAVSYRPDPSGHLNRPTPNLVSLQAFKQRFEVAFAKALVGFALDELKEHRAQ